MWRHGTCRRKQSGNFWSWQPRVGLWTSLSGSMGRSCTTFTMVLGICNSRRTRTFRNVTSDEEDRERDLQETGEGRSNPHVTHLDVIISYFVDHNRPSNLLCVCSYILEVSIFSISYRHYMNLYVTLSGYWTAVYNDFFVFFVWKF